MHLNFIFFYYYYTLTFAVLTLLPFHFSLSCIGEGNGNPLQCSCLENPRDRGAWWAAIYGIAQSQTRLKRLSSSSSRCIPRRRQRHPTPVLLPDKSHGRRSLVGCSPWGLKESDTTERLHFHFQFLMVFRSPTLWLSKIIY